jgi:hypothetical protein
MNEKIKRTKTGSFLQKQAYDCYRYVRYFEPSNFRAISFRYQAKMVSGLATQATYFSAVRPSRLPISASVDRSGSDSRSRAGRRARRICLRDQVLVLQQ